MLDIMEAAEHSSDKGSAWPGVYPGHVVNDQDPQKRGLLQIRVPQVYGSADDPVEQRIPDERLPWAAPCIPFGGAGEGAWQIPQVGAGVWVAFWMGDPEAPVWLGSFPGSSDMPERVTSAYAPGPQTRLVKTPTGHTFEMRWKEAEEEIRIDASDGSHIRITVADALGGPKIEGTTPLGRKWTVDDKLKKATLETPTQKVQVLDDPAPGKVSVTTPGDFEVITQRDIRKTAVGATQQTFTLASTLSFLAALALTVGGVLTVTVGTIAFTGALAMTMAGAFTLTVSGVVAITGAAVTLGVAGPKFRLVNETYITAIQNPNVTTFNAHVHNAPSGGGPTTTPQDPGGNPVTMTPAVVPGNTTIATTAN